jgi:hypothetical protein
MSESIQATLEVVSHILTDVESAKEVVTHNGWVEGLTQEQVAILFLTSRYQSSVDLLSRQTTTLKEEVDALKEKVDVLVGHVMRVSSNDE